MANRKIDLGRDSITNFFIGLIVFVMMQLFRNDIAGMFVRDPAVIALASEISFYYSFALILMGVNITAAMYFTALDKPVQLAVIALSRSFVVLIVGVLILPLLLGTTGIWLAFLFAEAVTLILVVFFYFRKNNRE